MTQQSSGGLLTGLLPLLKIANIRLDLEYREGCQNNREVFFKRHLLLR